MDSEEYRKITKQLDALRYEHRALRRRVRNLTVCLVALYVLVMCPMEWIAWVLGFVAVIFLCAFIVILSHRTLLCKKDQV